MYVMVDVESDGPIPGDYSMICFGAVIVRPGFAHTFFRKLHPISDKFDPPALAVSRYTREETLLFGDPTAAMEEFEKWLRGLVGKGRLMFISDNNGFDFQFINWYFWHFLNHNPFGHSSTNLGSLYKGLVKDMFKNFKHLRRTRHSHDPVDDSRGNAEALLHMKTLGLKIDLD